MKNFPVFPCSDGVVSLILNEIPYRKEAYILIRSIFGSPERLLRECVDFCRSAGADAVYVSGEGDLSHLPVYARLTERSLEKSLLPQTAARAELTENPEWTELYNQSFRHVPNAKTYLETPENAYFIYNGEERIGLGQIIDDELAAVASLKKGYGQDCVCALAKNISQTHVKLLCAEENYPATRLYDRLGFSRDRIKRIWHLAP